MQIGEQKNMNELLWVATGFLFGFLTCLIIFMLFSYNGSGEGENES
jgi:hypothetical protein